MRANQNSISELRETLTEKEKIIFDQFIGGTEEESDEAFDKLSKETKSKMQRMYSVAMPSEKDSETKVSDFADALFSKDFAKTAGQGITLGYGDELAGLFSSIFSKDPDAYTKARDQYRSDVSKFEKENPYLSLAGQFATALPLGFLAAPSKYDKAKKLTGLMSRVSARNPYKVGIGTGLLGGGVAGFGFSDKDYKLDPKGTMGDIAMGSAFGAGGNVAGQALQQVASPFFSRFTNMFRSPDTLAKSSVLKSLGRDELSLADVYKQMEKDPTLARLATSAGPETQKAFDTLTTLAGTSSSRAKEMREESLGGRAPRLRSGIRSSLLPNVTDTDEYIDQFTKQAEIKARPLYEYLKKQPIDVSENPKLESILTSAKKLGAFKGAQKIAAADEVPFSLSQEGPDVMFEVNFQDLQTVKRALYDMSVAAREKEPTLANSLDGLRKRLIKEIEDATTLKQDTKIGNVDYSAGTNLYGDASKIWAGKREFENALEQGKDFFKANLKGRTNKEIKSYFDTLTDTEKEAFRIGAYESLFDKLGSNAGKNELLSLRDPKKGGEEVVAEKMKIIFPDDESLSKFVDKIDVEYSAKVGERFGQGTQTAQRGATARQMADDAVDAYNIIDPSTSLMTGLASILRRAGTAIELPEPVRDRAGDIYSMKLDDLRLLDLPETIPTMKEDELQTILNRMRRTAPLQYGLLQPAVNRDN